MNGYEVKGGRVEYCLWLSLPVRQISSSHAALSQTNESIRCTYAEEQSHSYSAAYSRASGVKHSQEPDIVLVLNFSGRNPMPHGDTASFVLSIELATCLQA